MVTIEDAERVAVPCSLLTGTSLCDSPVGGPSHQGTSLCDSPRVSAGVMERLVREEHLEHNTIRTERLPAGVCNTRASRVAVVARDPLGPGTPQL